MPAIGPEEILLRVEVCGICAGDLKATQPVARFWGGDGMPGYCEPPFIPEHEFVGVIAAKGERAAPEFSIGERVCVEQIVPCGACRYCRDGRYWLCAPHDVFGFKRSLNGGMAEYVRLPRNARLYKVPTSFTLEQAALIEPYACSLHAVRRAGIQVDDVVVLAGAGTLGLGMVGAIKLRNPRKLIALDLSEERLRLARRFGADITIQPNREDAIRRVLDLTDGYGCDVYIEATGHPSAVPQGLEMICKGGTFVEFSVFSAPRRRIGASSATRKKSKSAVPSSALTVSPPRLKTSPAAKPPPKASSRTALPWRIGRRRSAPRNPARPSRSRFAPHPPCTNYSDTQRRYFHDENWRADRRRRRSARH